MRVLKKISLFAVLVLILLSFQVEDTPTTEPSDLPLPKLVQEALDKKINQFKLTILKKCKADAIANAEIYIDSLMAEELNLMASDTLTFPAKPTRPGLPETIILNDSTGIAPIIK